MDNVRRSGRERNYYLRLNPATKNDQAYLGLLSDWVGALPADVDEACSDDYYAADTQRYSYDHQH